MSARRTSEVLTIMAAVLIVTALLIDHAWADSIMIFAGFMLVLGSYTLRRHIRSNAYSEIRSRASQKSSG